LPNRETCAALEVLYFASGSSRLSDLLGFVDIGHPVGVVAPELNVETLDTLCTLAGTGVPLFVDSGAFSEVEITGEGVKVVCPITRSDWADRLAIYRRLAVALGDQVYLVAPDKVGFQQETLMRLSRYVDKLSKLASLGAHILVPIQKGDMTQADFHRAVAEVLGETPWIPALPCKKAATTTDEVIAYCKEIQPPRVHLLGLGQGNRAAPHVLSGVAAVSPSTSVLLDSCLLRSSVGWTNGPGGGPSSLTIAEAIIKASGLRPPEARRAAVSLAFGPDFDQVWGAKRHKKSRPSRRVHLVRGEAGWHWDWCQDDQAHKESP